MAARKMTFSIPDETAARFLREVAPRDRSRFVSQMLEESLREKEQDLIRACLEANEDEDIQAIEREFDALPDTMEEPWDGPLPSR